MFSKDRVKLNRNTKKVYISLALFVGLGLTFFLTSGFVFEKKIPVMASPINEEIEITSSKSINIFEWKYDKEKQKMQVLIDMNEVQEEYEELKTKAYQRSDGEEVQSNIIFEYDNKIVIEINGFEDEYKQIALDLIANEKENNGEEKEENTIIKTLYMDDREVNKSNIKDHSDEKMISYITDKMIEKINESIDKTKKEISENEEMIQEKEQKIEEITSEKVYQTDEEIVESDADINALTSEINSLKEDNTLLENDIKRMKEKIEKLQIKEREETLE